MTDQMIQKAVADAKSYSRVFGYGYILSNGSELKVAIESQVEEYKEQGYWVAAIFHNDLQVDL